MNNLRTKTITAMWNHPPHRRGVLGVLLLLVLVAGWALAQDDDLYRLPSASTRVFHSGTHWL
ncbi:MAG: hypothetical protein CUN56_14085 [Phototrophicales bacterium]|nr:MAG: hypothetical protein CUN56_14085 [Phototrophicales bacterium]